MYCGRIQEEAPVEQLFAEPLHPYTVGLLGSIPVFGEVKGELAVILAHQPACKSPPGCRFASRCWHG